MRHHQDPADASASCYTSQGGKRESIESPETFMATRGASRRRAAADKTGGEAGAVAAAAGKAGDASPENQQHQPASKKRKKDRLQANGGTTAAAALAAAEGPALPLSPVSPMPVDSDDLDETGHARVRDNDVLMEAVVKVRTLAMTNLCD